MSNCKWAIIQLHDSESYIWWAIIQLHHSESYIWWAIIQLHHSESYIWWGDDNVHFVVDHRDYLDLYTASSLKQ